MSRTLQVLLGLAALVVIGFGAIYLLGAVQTARSPEYKCQQVMRDIERDRGPLTPGAWNAGYEGCLDSLRARSG